MRLAISPARLATLLVLSLLAFSAPLRAQVADAAIEVVVLDPSDQAIPGVTVTARQVETGFTREAVTDAAGAARLPALPPGSYDVKFEIAGFAPATEKLTLRVGETGRIHMQLRLAGVSETVTVTAEATPVVDLYKIDSSSNIVPEQIEALPVVDRDFQRLAFLVPGVQRERGGFRFIGGGPVIGAGGNASQSTILVDGVDFTDPTLGLARARFSQDAISEFRVINNRFDTEIGGSAGGAMSIVTKSGTNDVKGSAFAFFRDDALRKLRKFETEKYPYSRQQYGGTLGGPIVRDQTHYFVSFEQISENNTVIFSPGGAYAATAGFPKVPLDQSLFYGGVDHQISKGQNLRTKFVYERYRQENFRVGGVADASSGMDLDRDNYNFTASHSAARGAAVNQLALQVGRRHFEEPNNSTGMAEYFSSGNTLVSGANIVGDQVDTGDIVEFRDTLFRKFGSGRWAADMKIGGAWQYVKDTWDFPVYPRNMLIYVTDTRALPLLYVGATGTGESSIGTHLLSGFAQADFRPSSRVTMNLGLRYDLDTNGNNPTYTSAMQPEQRGRDANNFQPRGGLSWDLNGKGEHVIRGGVGLFTGRFLLVPSHTELQQNGYTGRIIQQRINGAFIGFPAFAMDPANPATTGVPLPRDVSRLDATLISPQALQATGGYTARLGTTGLFLDFEGIYVHGYDELIVRDTNWKGNATPGRVNASWNQINTYTNEGHSTYKAFVTSMNGTVKGGHVLTASFTVADKKNIEDDFSPALVDYPSDPADIEAEYGRARADERFRFVASGVFNLPGRLQLAPIFEYGSGQPWNHRLGYDYNGDGKTSDRPAGVAKFSENGPRYAAVNLRATYNVPLGEARRLELMAEVFNLTNRINYDVNSIQSGQFLSGPTLANPGATAVANPRFGQSTAALPSLEAQFGFRFVF